MEREHSTQTVRTGSLALAVVYAVLTPLYFFMLSGDPHLVMTVLAGASAILLGAVHLRIRRGARSQGSRIGDRYLLAVCAVPVVNSLVQLGVTGQLEHTTPLMLALVAVAAVNPYPRQVVSLLVTATLTWAVLVWWITPEPRSLTSHYLIQMTLAQALAAGVFLVRSRIADALGRFRSVFEDSPVGISVADEHGRFVEVNAALCATLGRPAREVLGHSAADFTHPDDMAVQTGAGRRIAAAADGVARLEKRYVRPDGTVRWAWVTLRHVPGPTGQTYTLAHIQDVTAHKADEEQLRRSREAMAARAEIASASQRNADVRPVAVDAARRFSRARAAALLELNDRASLSVTAASEQDSLFDIEIDLTEPSATARVWRSGRPLFISHADDNPLVNQRLRRLVVAGSMMWHPVIVAGEVRAVMVVIWDESDVEETEDKKDAVAMVAAEVSSALMAEDMRSRLEEATVTDPLTGLLNRRGWERETATLMAHSMRSQQPFTVAMIDLDHFKRFNDTHGHSRGDEALASFAGQAMESLRAVDVLARWGGEEFALALRDTTAEQAAAVLERLRARPSGELTCSIGYCEVAPGGSAADGLAIADRALYDAKAAGRDRIHSLETPGTPDTAAIAV